MNGAMLSPQTAFAPTQHAGREYVRELHALRPLAAVGVYLITDQQRRPLYIGECHSPRAGAFYDTITRHFRAWTGKNGRYPDGRREGGKQYDRRAVLLNFALLGSTDPAIIAAAQYAEIQRLRPRDNDIDGAGIVRAGTIEATTPAPVEDLPI